jgi:two-component system cell cycle response regulator
MKILVADDDPISRKVIQGCLTDAGYDVAVAVDGAEALEMISKPDSRRLMVLERTMPHVDGVDVCRAIRKKALEPDVYIILITGQGEREDVVEGFEAGADDYMTKPFDLAELKARVRTGARILERQVELIAARAQLRAGAMYDSLTGLLNRAAFFDIFKKEVSRAERYETPLALIMADLDHFKETNDRHGHPAGDKVLAETARRLRTSLRVSDSIGRYGGDEFVIVAPGCTANSAALLAERFRLIIATQPVVLEPEEIHVTMSFGVAGTADLKNADDLLRAADEALSRAKNSGRNRVKGAERGGSS